MVDKMAASHYETRESRLTSRETSQEKLLNEPFLFRCKNLKTQAAAVFCPRHSTTKESDDKTFFFLLILQKMTFVLILVIACRFSYDLLRQAKTQGHNNNNILNKNVATC